jgi:hypothetical protein
MKIGATRYHFNFIPFDLETKINKCNSTQLKLFTKEYTLIRK